MLSPTRQAIADELKSKIDSTEGLLVVLQEFHDIVVSAETMEELHAGFYRVFKMGKVNEETLKDWMKFLERHIGSEILDREEEQE